MILGRRLSALGQIVACGVCAALLTTGVLAKETVHHRCVIEVDAAMNGARVEWVKSSTLPNSSAAVLFDDDVDVFVLETTAGDGGPLEIGIVVSGAKDGAAWRLSKRLRAAKE